MSISLLRYDRIVIVVADDLGSFHAINAILPLSYALQFALLYHCMWNCVVYASKCDRQTHNNLHMQLA